MVEISFLLFLLMIGFGVVKLIRRYVGGKSATPQLEPGFSASETLGIYTRLTDAAASILWPFPPPAKVRLAFPCPACYQPLLGKVAPGEDLICPWCRTTFQTPEPPPAAPPVPKKVLKEARPKKGFSFVGFLKGLSIIFGLITYTALVIIALVDEPLVWLILLWILVAGWVIQALHRRFWDKKAFLPATLFGAGGGNVFASELLRVTVVVGMPFAFGLVFWLFGICCLLPVFGSLSRFAFG